MKTKLALQSTVRFTNRLKKLHSKRRNDKDPDRGKRQSLTDMDHKLILNKTGKRYHICGGKIKKNEKWQADHIFPYVHGGKHSHDNYLPAHSMCNRDRWPYSAEEFQWIIKLGVWIRTQIEKDKLDATLIEKFIKKERTRVSRQRNIASDSVAS